jgi:hypothetical protein
MIGQHPPFLNVPSCGGVRQPLPGVNKCKRLPATVNMPEGLLPALDTEEALRHYGKEKEHGKDNEVHDAL